MRHTPHHFQFGLSAGARFYHAEDDGSTATTGATPATETLSEIQPETDGKGVIPAASSERVEGEKLPDFSGLGKKKVEESPKPPEGGKDTQKEEKPAGEAPASTATPPKEPAKDAKQTEKAPEPEKKAEKAPESKKDEKKELPEIPKDDKDLDSLQPKPNAPANIIKSFNDIKAIAARERASARRYAAELETIQKESAALKEATGKLPEDVEKELNELRQFNLLFQAENDPRFKKEFEEKVTAADTKIFGLLKKHGLNDKVIEEIKATGDISAWPRLKELLNAFKNPIDQQELVNAIQGRRDILGAKSARIAEIGQSREKFMEAINQQQDAERMTFAKGIEKRSIDLAASRDWIREQEIPADATAEQKKVLEERNAAVSKRATEFSENVRAAYMRDPDKSAEIALKAVEADYLRQQNEELSLARDKATARNKELESQLAKIKSAGRMAHAETPQETTTQSKTTVKEGMVGGDGSTALRDFFKNK